MSLNRLRKEFPTMPESIRSMIGQEVEHQLNIDRSTVKRAVRDKRFWLKTAAIAAAAALILGATAFTGMRLLGLRTQKQGEYGFAAVAITDKGIPSELPVLSAQPGWLPEGFVPAGGENGLKYFRGSSPGQGGLSMELLAMDENITFEEFTLLERYVTDSSELTINGHEAAALQMQVADDYRVYFDKRIYISLPEYWQVLVVYAGEDVAMEDVIRFAESLTVTDTGETYVPSRSLSDMADSTEVVPPTDYTATEEEILGGIKKLGESFSVYESDQFTEYKDISVKVTDVRYMDDYSLLDEQYVDDMMRSALDESGKLKANTVDFIAPGDGIDTLDEVIYTRQVEQKLVYVTIEVTNNRPTDCKNLIYGAEFFAMKKEGDVYRAIDGYRDRALADGDDRTEQVRYKSIGGFGEMHYYDVHGSSRGNNYIPLIKAGETVELHVAHVINADDAANMYLSFTPEGGAQYLSPATRLNGYVDIRG